MFIVQEDFTSSFSKCSACCNHKSKFDSTRARTVQSAQLLMHTCTIASQTTLTYLRTHAPTHTRMRVSNSSYGFTHARCTSLNVKNGARGNGSNGFAEIGAVMMLVYLPAVSIYRSFTISISLSLSIFFVCLYIFSFFLCLPLSPLFLSFSLSLFLSLSLSLSLSLFLSLSFFFF